GRRYCPRRPSGREPGTPARSEGRPGRPVSEANKRQDMAQRVSGVVAREKGKPVTIETVVVPDPGPGEAVVAVQACGVCHTDLHYREGGITDGYPFLLGHEAAGVVERSATGWPTSRPATSWS